MKMIKILRAVCLYVSALLLWSPLSATATLIGFTAENPLVVYRGVHGEGLAYDAAADLLEVRATPLAVQLDPLDPLLAITGSRFLTIGLQVDEHGALLGGVAADDFILHGQIGDAVVAETLLTGEVLEFGYEDLTTTVDAFDFLFRVTGGSMSHQFIDSLIGVTMTLGNSDFTGSFAGNFSSAPVMGQIGSVVPVPVQETGVIPEPPTTLLLCTGVLLMLRRHATRVTRKAP